MCPASVSFAALLRFFCASTCQMEASNAPARCLSAGPFNLAGFSPGPLDGRTVRRREPPVAWLPGTPGSFANRRRTAFHAAPDIRRAFCQTTRAPAPPRRQRKPVYP